MKSIIVLVLALFFENGYSQTLMTIDNQSISLDEFKKIYQKNNTAAVSYSRKDINEYLNLFTLYKMKLMHAQALRMDTMTAIQDDYVKYTDQLVKKMLTDKNYVENIYRSQYEHMKLDVKVAHIMVKCDQNASPSDSLIAYNKIKFIRDKTTPSNFAEMAKENSEDKGSAVNGGTLGFITAFMTADDFEEQCYTTGINALSPIFRTQFGYHILKVLDKRAARGRVKAAHIYINDKSEEETKKKIAETEINKAYKELINKVPFDQVVAKYSKDKSSIEKQGELPEFGVSEMIQEFEDQAFALKNKGDFTKPFKTDFGWHIIRLNERLPIKSFEESRDYIKQRLERDPRIVNMSQVIAQRVADKYQMKENSSTLNEFIKMIPDTFFANKKWVIKVQNKLSNESLFSLDNKNYTLGQFASYSNSKFNATVSPKSADLVKAMYNEYRERMLWDVAKAKLKAENEDYRNLETEYMNGLMIFELMDREIWKKAVNDSNGSKKIYEELKNDFKYNTRMNVESVVTRNKEVNEKLNIASIGYKSAKDLLNAMKKTSDSNEVIYMEKTIEKGDDPKLDAQKWIVGNVFSYFDDVEKTYSINYVQKVLPPSVKPYTEIKGRVQNIYQTRLEAQYNQSLKNKYKVNIMQDVLNKIIKE